MVWEPIELGFSVGAARTCGLLWLARGSSEVDVIFVFICYCCDCMVDTSLDPPSSKIVSYDPYLETLKS